MEDYFARLSPTGLLLPFLLRCGGPIRSGEDHVETTCLTQCSRTALLDGPRGTDRECEGLSMSETVVKDHLDDFRNCFGEGVPEVPHACREGASAPPGSCSVGNRIPRLLLLG